MKCISRLFIISLCLVAFPVEASRPTIRTLRLGAYNLEEVRRATYGQKEEEYQTFRNEALGFAIEYPKEWETSYVTAKSLADQIVNFAPVSNPKSSFSVWVKEKGRLLMYQDLRTDLARFTRQPENDFQVRTMSYIHKLKNLKTRRVWWKGQSVLLSTFEAGGVQDPYNYKQIRIPIGERLYVLNFVAPIEFYDDEVYRFDVFLKSFKVFEEQRVETLIDRREERRLRRLKLSEP